MAKPKLNKRKHKTGVVTGDFELHFEDVVNRNRYMLALVIAGGLLLLGLIVPGVVYYSHANNKAPASNSSVPVNPER